MLNTIDTEPSLSEQNDSEETIEEITESRMPMKRMNCAFGPSAMETDADITETFSSLSESENIEEKLQGTENSHDREEGANIRTEIQAFSDTYASKNGYKKKMGVRIAATMQIKWPVFYF
ncbi:hypothetical protein G6F57_000112 [Rhizopus arrhizus]|uniref:Uncharacterized protein n=1 Tax=Rhizopus oryzae TaxID=64495 RepID=A0A9P6XKL7_RHIOR|nr:hypothetical protein G6F30_000195 [Rhizopus arrhizus]KAG1428839.1 hypothetical protein G6F58_000376 [Rhizopus delemar]KAG0990498.1 hypothetical protein G6F29_000189 [Rhizopus arrhizus]KAG1000268.1 hypothetical protein G6F28_000207 [Rhizopus arrhizus]KAG1015419.1 hypothetical protein G6F27_000077 [Rhizopus arrhizus]